jgi:excisionase family DNA binding protein
MGARQAGTDRTAAQLVSTPQRSGIKLDAILDDLVERISEKIAERIAYRPSHRELLTAKETAEYIGRSLGAVYQLIARGDLPCVRHGRRVHVRLRDLQNWIERDSAE